MIFYLLADVKYSKLNTCFIKNLQFSEDNILHYYNKIDKYGGHIILYIYLYRVCVKYYILFIFCLIETMLGGGTGQLHLTAHTHIYTQQQQFSRQGYQHFDTSPAPPATQSNHRRVMVAVRPFCVAL